MFEIFSYTKSIQSYVGGIIGAVIY